MSLRMGWIAAALVAVFAFCANVQAAEVKIGVFDLQKILTQSAHGQAAKQRFEGRVKELEAQLKPEQDALVAMGKDIEKKSSAWDENVKADKIRDFQKRQREFQVKKDDAGFELKQLQGKEMEPFMRALQDVVGKIGKSGGYTMIVDARAGLLYFDKSIDLSDTIIKQLDAALK